MSQINFNLICEQVFFQKELSVIAENAEKIVKKLESLKDFSDEANATSEEAKLASRTNSFTPIDTSALRELRNELRDLLKSKLWPNAEGEELEARMDNYIKKAFIEPGSVMGIQGERLSPDLNLRGLRYLHRDWIR